MVVSGLTIIILCAVIGGLIGLISKSEKGDGEDKPKNVNIRLLKPGQLSAGTGGGTNELWEKMKEVMIPGAIFGAIMGVLLSIFSIIALGLNGLLGTAIMLFSGALLGAIALMLFVLVKSLIVQILGDRGSRILSGLIVGIILGLLINLFILPAGGSAALEYWKIGLDPVGKVVGDGLQEVAKWKYCFQADPRCPFWINWDPEIQSPEEVLEVNVNFKNKDIRQDTIKLDALISVSNPEVFKLHLVPKCYLGDNFEKSREIRIENMGSYASGNEFVFDMSSETQETSLTCSSEVPECTATSTNPKNVCSTNVYLVLERPVILNGVWPIYIGQKYSSVGPKQVKTELANNVPYSIALHSPNDLPFDQGKQGGYKFYIAIKQRDEDTTLKNIEIIRIIFPEGIMADCDYFSAEGNELVIRNINETWMKANYISYDSVDKEYSFSCYLQVTKAPIYAERAAIEIESSYTVESRYSTKIIKQPSG